MSKSFQEIVNSFSKIIDVKQNNCTVYVKGLDASENENLVTEFIVYKHAKVASEVAKRVSYFKGI